MLRPTLTPTPKPTAEAAGEQLSGHVVFQSRRVDTNEDGVLDVADGIHLYRLDIALKQTTQLTTGHQRDTFPQANPQADQIAFVSNQNGEVTQLYVMNGDGSERRQVTETGGQKTCPVWSPDGRQIAYVVTQEDTDNQNGLALFDLSTTQTRPLLSLPAPRVGCPSWSPDGAYLAIGYELDDQSHIALLVLDTGERIELTLGEGRFDEPQFLPRADGLFLSVMQIPSAFSSAALLVFQLDENSLTPTQQPLLVIEDMFGGYSWAQGGEWLISTEGFAPHPSSADRRNGYELVKLPIEFSQRVQTTRQHSLFAFNLSEQLTENEFYDDQPTWSP